MFLPIPGCVFFHTDAEPTGGGGASSNPNATTSSASGAGASGGGGGGSGGAASVQSQDLEAKGYALSVAGSHGAILTGEPGAREVWLFSDQSEAVPVPMNLGDVAENLAVLSDGAALIPIATPPNMPIWRCLADGCDPFGMQDAPDGYAALAFAEPGLLAGLRRDPATLELLTLSDGTMVEDVSGTAPLGASLAARRCPEGDFVVAWTVDDSSGDSELFRSVSESQLGSLSSPVVVPFQQKLGPLAVAPDCSIVGAHDLGGTGEYFRLSRESDTPTTLAFEAQTGRAYVAFSAEYMFVTVGDSNVVWVLACDLSAESSIDCVEGPFTCAHVGGLAAFDPAEVVVACDETLLRWKVVEPGETTATRSAN